MLRTGINSVSKLKPLIRSISLLSRSPLSSPQPQPPFPSSYSLPKPFFFFSFPFSSKPTKLSLNRDGNYADEDQPTPQTPSPTNPFRICHGCGVHMQNSDPKTPGFFLKPSKPLKSARPPKLDDFDDLRPVVFEPEFSDSLKRGFAAELEEGEYEEEEEDKIPVVCARCHSLRYYGRVKDAKVENLLPDFDFDRTVARKIALCSAGGARSVLLMVVDAADFDGSFPRRVAKTISDSIAANSRAWKEGKSGNVARMVVVATKMDLLPTSLLSTTSVEHWVRSRAREGGAHGKLCGVHMVSALQGWGIRKLAEDVAALAGPRGRVWAVGAQNAGKSTLINALAKLSGAGKVISHLTEAPVPGTTLGIVRVEGVLPGSAKVFDTPGMLQLHQITTRLTREEQKLVSVSKELKPRTYRIKAGNSVHIAGLARLDIEELSVNTVYITVWASHFLPLHMGKTENAQNMFDDHVGRQLQPPIGRDRAKKLGQWVRKEFRISGNSWEASSVDIAVSGLGWFAIGLKGEAALGVWTCEGVDVVLRNSLLPHRARIFEESGYTVSKIVSKADKAWNKKSSSSSRQSKDKKQNETTTTESTATTTESTTTTTDKSKVVVKHKSKAKFVGKAIVSNTPKGVVKL